MLFSAAVLLFFQHAGAEDSSSFNRKGMFELNSNHPDRAVEYFLQAITADPGQKHFYNNLAKVSLQLDNNYARALSNMAVTLFHLGRYGESYKYYLSAMGADPGYSEKRFDKKRVFHYIKKLSAEKPQDKKLKRIKDYMESGD